MRGPVGSKIKGDGIWVSSTQVKMIRRLGERALKVESEVLGALISLIVVIVCFGIIVRYTPISGQTLWTTELARLSLLWAVFWGAGSIERSEGHFKFNLFESLFSGKLELFVQLSIKLIVLLSMGLLIWWTIVFAEDTMGQSTYLLQWPGIVRIMPLLCGSLLLSAHCLIGFIRILRRLFE